MIIINETEAAYIMEHEDKTFMISKAELDQSTTNLDTRVIGYYMVGNNIWHVTINTPYGDLVVQELERVQSARHITEFHFTIAGITQPQAEKTHNLLVALYGQVGRNFGFIHLDLLPRK
jgi:hypothetical protein